MVDRGVRLRSITFLQGPNLYASMPVMKVTLDIGLYDRRPSDSFPGFVDRLVEWLPDLQKHECSLGQPGGFVERLRRGTYLAHIVEHVTLELQRQMGFRVTFGRARGTGEPGVYTVVIAYREEEPARVAFHTALRLTLAAMHDDPFDTQTELEHLLELAEGYRLGPSTEAIVRAARKRWIPILRLTPRGGLVQLGWGVHQRRIRASVTSNSSAIAVDLCRQKSLTNRILSAVKIPTPTAEVVRSPDDAWAAAQRIGLPVVVKPEAGNQGRGVSVGLRTEAEVRDAFAIAHGIRGDVMVERYIEGDDYRVLVVDGKMVAAARRDAAHVVGDGRNTIRELVEAVNRDPRRRPGHGSMLTRIRLDDAARLSLEGQGLTEDSVPAAGRAVKLRTNANLSTGGTAADVTDTVHPRNVQLAELAAQMVALDVAGIDIICRDISRPLAEQGGAIVEVNASPGLRMHLSPSEGRPRDVGTPIVEMLYPGNAPSRIPVIAVTGTNGKTTVTRLIAFMHETAHRVVGMTTTEGIFINGERIVAADASGPKSARTVLLHPAVEVAVLETARGGILRAGLAFDHCMVGVVTNVSRDHMGIGGVNTLEELARVKQVVVASVARSGAAVLNADDPLVAEMAAATKARVVYFSLRPGNSVLTSHLADGGRAVFVDDGSIKLAEGEDVTDLINLRRVGFTAGGRIRFQVQNALAATAAAWSAGLNPALIARALATFATDTGTLPGRFNVSERNGVQIIFDYAHNVEAMKALGQAAEALGARRTVLLTALPGDRPDEDLVATLHATIPFVDEYIQYDPVVLRARAPGEVSGLLARHIPDGVPHAEVASFREGVQRAAEAVRPGDRLIVTVEKVDAALEDLQQVLGSIAEGAICTNPIQADVTA